MIIKLTPKGKSILREVRTSADFSSFNTLNNDEQQFIAAGKALFPEEVRRFLEGHTEFSDEFSVLSIRHGFALKSDTLFWFEKQRSGTCDLTIVGEGHYMLDFSFDDEPMKAEIVIRGRSIHVHLKEKNIFLTMKKHDLGNMTMENGYINGSKVPVGNVYEKDEYLERLEQSFSEKDAWLCHDVLGFIRVFMRSSV